MQQEWQERNDAYREQPWSALDCPESVRQCHPGRRHLDGVFVAMEQGEGPRQGYGSEEETVYTRQGRVRYARRDQVGGECVGPAIEWIVIRCWQASARGFGAAESDFQREWERRKWKPKKMMVEKQV